MSKKFAEYSKFDLSNVNKEILKNGKTAMSSIRVLKSEKVILLSYSTKDRLLLTACRVFTMSLPVRLKIFSVVTRP